MKKILSTRPGQWDSLLKAYKYLAFLTSIVIRNSSMNIQLATNSWLSVDFSGVLGSKMVDFAFLNINNCIAELDSIPNGNAPVEVYDMGNTYEVTNGKGYVRLRKYMVFGRETNISDYIDNPVRMGTKSVLGQSDSKNLFKCTKNKGPIDLVIVDDELTAIGNRLGSRFPVVQNTVQDSLGTDPTDMYRSFSFDKLDGKTVVLDLLQTPEGNNNDAVMNTWLHAQVTIDTAITFNFYERLIPISKRNWRY